MQVGDRTVREVVQALSAAFGKALHAAAEGLQEGIREALPPELHNEMTEDADRRAEELGEFHGSFATGAGVRLRSLPARLVPTVKPGTQVPETPTVSWPDPRGYAEAPGDQQVRGELVDAASPEAERKLTEAEARDELDTSIDLLRQLYDRENALRGPEDGRTQWAEHLYTALGELELSRQALKDMTALDGAGRGETYAYSREMP